VEKALLTGGNGNLGRHVANHLLDAGIEVVKFDLPGTEPDAVRPGETIITGDIRDSGLVENMLRQHKPDAVYHLASLLSGSSEDDLAAAWQINATASFDLMRLAVEFEVERLFFASTGASYGPGLGDPLPEHAEQWPENLYGATKVAVERLGVYFKTKHGLDFRCLRFPLVVSPFAPKAAVTAYPSHAFKAALADEPFVFPVSPEVGMSAMFFEDVIDGIVKFTLADRAQVRRHAYNLHAYFVSAEMVAEQIIKHVPSFQFSYQPVATVEALMTAWPDVIADQSARDHWGWDPQFDFARSATRMFELLQGN
jgi:threonine 3-dehydrogenase